MLCCVVYILQSTHIESERVWNDKLNECPEWEKILCEWICFGDIRPHWFTDSNFGIFVIQMP